MNSAEYVSNLIREQKAAGMDLQTVSWNAALACVGWPYVFGARWEYCTPQNRRKRASDKHPTIKSKCKNFNGSSSVGCKGCQWYPNEKLTRQNDCRGFTYGVLDTVCGWELMGAGCTSQWNTESNWSAKGTIDTIPEDTLVCLFVQKGKTMEHTGFGYHGETVECSSGVQYFKTRNKKWTHWGAPACFNYKPEPVPAGWAKVTGKNVALRRDPSTAAAIITRIKTGEKVKLEPEPEKTWDYVRYQGNKGWMMRAYLKENDDNAVVTGKRVALRVDPCLRAKIIMRIDTGKIVWLEQEPPKEWDYVSYGGQKGYMMRKYLEEGA